MYEILNGLRYIRTYINDCLIISDTYFEEHINKLVEVEKGFKINAEIFFAKIKLEYLVFTMNMQQMIPLPDKVEAIKNIVVTTKRKIYE